MKYERYEEALYRALCHIHSHEAQTHPRIEVVVAGAGRGPLVDATLRAWKRLTKKPDMYKSEKGHEGPRELHILAIEKNQYAMKGLRRRMSKVKRYPGLDECTYKHHSDGTLDMWDPEVVTLLHKDMRNWNEVREHITSSEGAHIVVSELLGSFGDNELSPECLEGVHTILHAEYGVCIPRRYTSYIAPVACSKLWMQARDLFDGKGLETPFVVNMFSFTQLALSKPVFTFTHISPVDNKAQQCDLSTSLFFEDVEQDCIMHGFVGYFDAELYPADPRSVDDGCFAPVVLSTNPQNRTNQMMSWFPMYFPIEKPVTLGLGQRVEATMWRCSSKQEKKVWYEWAVTSPLTSKIHNGSGCCSSISFLEINDLC